MRCPGAVKARPAAYDRRVDPAQLIVVALTVALVAAVGVVAWALSTRGQRPADPITPHELPDGAISVLSVLPGSAIVVADDDLVLRASAPAYAQGLVHGTRLSHPGLAELIDEVRQDGQVREREFVLPRRPGVPERHISARVAPLGAAQFLALVEDRSQERQLQAVRRDFVANVSHELKTPVGAIRLLAEATRDACDDPEAIRRFSKRTRKEADRLSRLVQQIIELSRLQGDEPIESPVVVSVDKVIAAAIDVSTIEAEARHITVLTEGEAGVEVWGNEEQLVIAVGNLVANAVAYSPDSSAVVVRVRRTQLEAQIEVIDQGIGIPEADLDRVFERFYRVDPARHRSTGGTGLGLSIVKHIAATHGGEVTAWSVEGQGSTFTLNLPLAKEEESE